MADAGQDTKRFKSCEHWKPYHEVTFGGVVGFPHKTNTHSMPHIPKNEISCPHFTCLVAAMSLFDFLAAFNGRSDESTVLSEPTPVPHSLVTTNQRCCKGNSSFYKTSLFRPSLWTNFVETNDCWRACDCKSVFRESVMESSTSTHPKRFNPVSPVPSTGV